VAWKVRQECSFLKKRTKKLLFVGARWKRTSAHRTGEIHKSFLFLFSKNKSFFFPLTLAWPQDEW
jgi:hypothetical protein